MSTNEFRTIRSRILENLAADLAREADGVRYVRRFLPPERLIILGGGHVSQALCAVAALLDYAVTVVDDRPEFADRGRFPAATEVICGPFEETIEALRVSSGDCVCIVTRGHRWDDRCLRKILDATMPSYLGMIGSRRRTGALLEQLAADGYDPERIRQIHTPIGLPIGAVTPAEIAVSICAQLVQHRNSQTGRARVDGLLEQTGTDPVLLDYLADDPEPKALAIVLTASGSTPAKPGAMMAVNASGEIRGTVGGGWGEAQAIACARGLVGTGERRVIRVDMDNSVASEEGMACGGNVTILIEDASESSD